MDSKVMLRSYKGHKCILCIIDEVTNYLIAVPIHRSRSAEIGDTLIEDVISKYCVPNYIIMNQDSTFIVMYGSAVWFLSLSRGIGSCILSLV